MIKLWFIILCLIVIYKNSRSYLLFGKHDLKFSISYGSHGRFNKEQLELFKKNVDIQKRIRMVSCVMTKQNMNGVVKG